MAAKTAPPNWITGKITIKAAALVGALIVAAPKFFDVLDSRYAKKEEITALREEIKDLRRMVAGLDSSDKCKRNLVTFCR